MRKMGFEQVADELHALIRECDSETLAAIYENAFGAVKSCVDSDVVGYFNVEYHEGLEPD